MQIAASACGARDTQRTKLAEFNNLTLNQVILLCIKYPFTYTYVNTHFFLEC